jgi:ADP-heptose:LPS heptosyltransferase
MMPQTILIFLFGDLGDTILTVPAIRAIRRRYPRARVLLLSKPGPGSFVQQLGLVDEVLPIDKHGFDRLAGLARPRNLWSLARLLLRFRRDRVDSVVIFHHLVTRFGTLKYALLALATGAGTRVGLDNGRGWFLTRAVRDEGFGARHESQYWLQVAALLGATGSDVLEAPVRTVDVQEADRLLAPLQSRGGPLIAVHPGTGWYAPGRKWAPQKFAEVIDLLAVKHGARCVIVGSDEDRDDADALLAASETPVLDLVGASTVSVLAALLARCDVLIANDGGVGHLAAAVGTAVVSVFGPSNEAAWRPLTATVVMADLPCRPCLYRDFERGLPNGCGARQCLQLVTPNDVVAAVERRMAAEKSCVV